MPKRRKGRNLVLVLDAYALEAYLVDEPVVGPAVEQFVLSGEQLVISAVNLAEVADRMQRIHGVPRIQLEVDLAGMGLTISDVDTAVAFDAAALRATHYRRRTRALSMADCCAAALALDRDVPLVTSDPALLEMMWIEAGLFVALADRSGATWSPPGPTAGSPA